MQKKHVENKVYDTDVYGKELDLLDRAMKISSEKSLSKEDMYSEYALLQKEFAKLLKNSMKISKVADANQRKLIRLLDLEKQNLMLEQAVRDRTREIAEKNRLLEEQSDKLKELDRVKSRFFANISHEFRTPLTLIIGPLELLIAACADDEKKKKYAMMQRNAQRLLRLINQLLELSKLDSGSIKLQAAKIDIVPLITVIVSNFQPLADQNELELTLHTGLPVGSKFLFIDQRKIEDVLVNLLINAIKFTPPGGKITVTLEENISPSPNYPEGYLEIGVCDTGPGIPAAQLPHLFKRFYEADIPSERCQKGSGIGLSLAKELVELHHGEIAVKSREGDGCLFTIKLPLGNRHLTVEEMSAEPTPQTKTTSHQLEDLAALLDKESETRAKSAFDPEQEADAGKPPIILVVDDSPDMRTYIHEALVQDYTVMEAADGKEGIRLAEEYIPDIIVSDVAMPGADGFELCRTVKNDVATSHIPIILLTVKASADSMIKGLETGADDYITKPFNPGILKARIKNLLELRRHWQLTVNREMSRKPVKMNVSAIDREFINDLEKVLEKNLSNPDFNVEALCKKLYMSRPTVYRKIQALSGVSPTGYIRFYRLKRAAQLLESSFGSVTEVAFEVGFSSRTYFSKCFKEQFLQLPSAFHPSGSDTD
jgi:signal transduction histidine kinase/DNA-binding response OmpR family regulator